MHQTDRPNHHGLNTSVLCLLRCVWWTLVGLHWQSSQGKVHHESHSCQLSARQQLQPYSSPIVSHALKVKKLSLSLDLGQMQNCQLSAPSVTVVLFCVDSDPDKHYLMEEHERVPITVCEKEPSSIIAFALRWVAQSTQWHQKAASCIFRRALLFGDIFPLSCKKYKTALEDLHKVSSAGGDETPQAARWVRDLRMMYMYLSFYCYCSVRIKWMLSIGWTDRLQKT